MFYQSNSQNLEPTAPPVVIQRKYVTIGGDLQVGSLLSQIVYWHRPGKDGKTKLRVKRRGVLWIAKTREEWMQECCLTIREYKRAMATLKANKLIEVRVMRFNGIAMSHTRLLIDKLEEALEALAHADVSAKDETYQPAGTVCTNGSVHNVPTAWYETYHPLLTESTTENTTEITGGVLTHALEEQEKLFSSTSREKNRENENENGKEENMNADEILKQNKAKAKERLYGNSASKQPIAMTWQALVYPELNSFQSSLGVKQRAQLKKFATDAGDDAKDMLIWVVGNWLHTTSEVQILAGLENYPSDPDIGFLVLHRKLFMKLYVQSIAKQKTVVTPKPTPAAKEKVEIPVFTGDHNDPHPYKPTPEQYEAMIQSFKDGTYKPEDDD